MIKYIIFNEDIMYIIYIPSYIIYIIYNNIIHYYLYSSPYTLPFLKLSSEFLSLSTWGHDPLDCIS